MLILQVENYVNFNECLKKRIILSLAVGRCLMTIFKGGNAHCLDCILDTFCPYINN
jgi:hypothetical protein